MGLKKYHTILPPGCYHIAKPQHVFVDKTLNILFMVYTRDGWVCPESWYRKNLTEIPSQNYTTAKSLVNAYNLTKTKILEADSKSKEITHLMPCENPFIDKVVSHMVSLLFDFCWGIFTWDTWVFIPTKLCLATFFSSSFSVLPLQFISI